MWKETSLIYLSKVIFNIDQDDMELFKTSTNGLWPRIFINGTAIVANSVYHTPSQKCSSLSCRQTMSKLIVQWCNSDVI